MNENTLPQIFSFNGNDVRVVTDDNGEPWWVAKDVCDVLGLSNVGQALSSLDPDEKSNLQTNIINSDVDPYRMLQDHVFGKPVTFVDASRGGRPMSIVNEPGLYSLILRSRKPDAKAFKRWVTHDVLPSIRKTGAYGATQMEAIIAKFDLPRDYDSALEHLLKSRKETRKLESKLVANAPKVDFAENVMDSDSLMPVTIIAKSLGTGPIILNRFLSAEGLIRKVGGTWVPMHKYQHRTDLFKVVTFVHDVDGQTKSRQSLKWTQKGRALITELWRKRHAVAV